MKQERLDYVDYAKAIMIILSVVTHTGISSIFDGFVNVLFCLFFVCSGLTASVNVKPPREMIISRFKKMMLPYWAILAVYAIFDVWRAYYFGYGDYRIIYAAIVSMLYGVTYKCPIIPGLTDCLWEAIPYTGHPQGFVDIIIPSTGHLWFLPAMFTGTVIFIVYTHFVKKRGLLDAAMIIVLLAGTYFESLPWVAQLPLCLGRGFLACAYMIVGLNLRYFDAFAFSAKGYMIFAVSTLLAGAALYLGASEAVILLSIYPFGNIWGVFLFFAGGVSLTVSFLFTLKLTGERVRCRLLLDIAQNTMTIYLWHVMFLTIFGLLLLKIFGIQLVFDEYFCGFIPQGRWGIMLSTAALTIWMCMLLAKIKCKKV